MLSNKLTEYGFDIISGGFGGVMEAALLGAEHSNVKRIGVVPTLFESREANKNIDELIVVESYIDRLLKLIELGDVYIALPGNTGTLLEIAAVWALLEREQLKGKLLITVGEQWNQIQQTMAFYSEMIVDNYEIVQNVDNYSGAINIVKKHFNL